MKRLLMMLPLLLLVASEATAMEKHNSTTMTCAEIKAALQSEGKAQIRYPSKKVDGMMRYGNFVAGRQMCKMQQIAIRARVPASDKSCIVVQCTQYGRSASKY